MGYRFCMKFGTQVEYNFNMFTVTKRHVLTSTKKVAYATSKCVRHGLDCCVPYFEEGFYSFRQPNISKVHNYYYYLLLSKKLLLYVVRELKAIYLGQWTVNMLNPIHNFN